MALGLSTEGGGGGDFAEICKYDARAGRMFRVERTQGAAGWETNNVEITNGFQAVMDLENILVGWALFAAGTAPAFSMVRLGDPIPVKPGDTFKQGFKMMMKLGKSSGGDVRELSSCAKVVIGAIDALHTQFTTERNDHRGQLPVVALTGSTAVVSQGKGQSSTNYAPVFEIVKWVDRPDDLKAAAPPQAANQQTPPAQTVTQARTTSQVAPDDDNEF